ncbi:MAG: hypothetical protein KAU20_04765 [Nanoarchaeota archaeon]|nr:hypothetical protein [Nanoarchaeota archaeon]
MGKGNDSRMSVFKTFIKKAGDIKKGLLLKRKPKEKDTRKRKGSWGGGTIRIHCHRASTRYSRLQR